MSTGAPKVRSINVAESEARPILGPGGNKARSSSIPRKHSPKPNKAEEKKSSSPSPAPQSAPSVLRRQELLLRSNFSLNASCSSDASTDSFCSRASTGRIGRPSFTARRRPSSARSDSKVPAKLEKVVPDGASVPPVEISTVKRRCSWVTPNTDPCYVTFHDEEWGVPVHDDKKLFELLVLSGALAELTWPAILSKRHLFREVFMDFDPVLVSQLNEKKIMSPGSPASFLLSETKLRHIIENAHEIVKIIEEFGSFDRYCWSFVSYKPIVSRFRHPRQVPVKTPKADFISKDLVRRGLRVGPTVVYSFMQASGMTNDHLISCYRYDECNAAPTVAESNDQNTINSNHKAEEKIIGSDVVGPVDFELSGTVDRLSFS
ncbi:uncharacterized protein LOC109725883 [Ananas comosus]|uniref:Uncharacterized protein LOC109725883 n=1 Tax=Ananas comosus TaxID=4615 RepID=A0A6P5GSF9_ANACO|nr:uncharacterized protein LOC109725883 [Ananas comosus]